MTPMNNKIYPVAVVGGGAAGVMAVLRSVLNNDECIFYPGNAKHRKRSRAFWISKVENIPGFQKYQKGIDDPNRETLEWIEQSAVKEKLIHRKNVGVVSIRKVDDLFYLTDTQGEEACARYVVLCTGVMDVQPEINGSIAPVLPYANVQLVDYCLRCDGHHTIGKKAGVIGDSPSSIWVAIMLHERYGCPEMHFFKHGNKFEIGEEEKKLVEKYGINVHSEKISKVHGESKLKRLDAFELENGKKVELEICFVSLGMKVYNELAIQLNANLDQRGFVITNEKGKTNIDGLYIAGDLRANAKKQIYTAWDHAVDALDEINMLLRRMKRMT